MFKEINPNSKRTEIMEKEFIPYEQVLTLIELGFDRNCFGEYHNTKIKGYEDKNWIVTNEDYEDSMRATFICIAPTFSQAFRWFREKYGFIYEVNVYSTSDGYSYSFKILCKKYTPYIEANNSWLTYEEAELECLKKLIEIVKEK